MERPIYTDGSESPATKRSIEERNDFELPVSNFVSKPPRLPFQHSVALCEQGLDWATSRPDFEENRARSKVLVEFVM